MECERIATADSPNYYTRSGWSKKQELLNQKINGTTEQPAFQENIKSPFYFEFLGLSTKDAIDEADLENAIVSRLKNFRILSQTLYAAR